MINLTTKYFVDDENSLFSMKNLQDIEMMYRSLVLPAENSDNYLMGDERNSTYYYFTRPPLVNIVLSPDEGDSDDTKVPLLNGYSVNNGVYKNLFTEIITKYNPEGGYTHNIFYKNFVVTSVSIDKNDNDYNYYVEGNEDGGKFYDKMGFTVSLSILEIDENYLGSLPSFNNYYNTVRSRGTFAQQ